MENDPNDRYAHNPSAEDFQEKLNRSDNSQTLRSAEDTLNPVQRYLDKREDKKQSLRDAEATDWNNPKNNFYKPSEKAQTRINNWRNWSNRRKAGVAGGAAAGITGMLISVFALLPLKIPGIMSMITSEAGQRVEQVTEHRAKLILARAILRKFDSDLVVTGKGTFSTLVASMRTSNFEARLADKGLKITRDADGVRLTNIEGKQLGGGKVLKNETAIVKALDADKLTNKMIKSLVKEDIPSWRWIKRAKFAKWLRIKYGIPRYGLKNSDKADSNEAIKETEAERLKAESAQTTKNSTDFMGCLANAGEDCRFTEDNNGRTTTSSTSSSDVTDTLSDATDEAIQEALDNPGEDTSKLMSKILTKKFATKAIPIIGWIDLAATINHAVDQELENNFIGRAVAGIKESNYAQLYGNWSGYASQNQLGALRPDYIAKLSKQTDGVEQAQAFNMIEGKTKTSSTALLGSTAYAVSANDIPGVPVDRINSNSPGAIHEAIVDINNASKVLTAGIGRWAGDKILEAWYNTIGEGGLLGIAGDALGGLLSGLTPDSVKEWAGNFMIKMWDKILVPFGLDFNPLVSGPKWFNNAHGGATASLNSYAKETGLRKLSAAQASAQNQQIAQERAEYRTQKGPLYALFSTDEPNSITTQLAVRTPSNTDGAISSIASLVASAPTSILRSIMPAKASAANAYVDLYGVDPYGATQADLDGPLSQEFIDGNSCPDVPEGSFNSCKVDNEVAAAMLCEFQPESEDCAENDPASGTQGGGSRFRIGSFNIYYNTDDKPEHYDYSVTQWQDRLSKSSSAIKNNNLEVVGLQEVRKTQWQRIQDADMLGGTSDTAYDIYPKDYDAAGYAGQNPIVWQRNRFDLMEGLSIPGYQVTSPFDTKANTQVKLKDKETGQEFYVINIHEPVGGGASIGARLESAKLKAQQVSSLKSTGLPVFITGDFNSGYDLRSAQPTVGDNTANLAYCILSKDQLMKDALVASKNLDSDCPLKQGNGVDHIFMTPEVQASGYDNTTASARGNGSDVHNTVFVDITIPGTDMGGGAELTIASYNVLGAIHTATFESRMDKVINNIASKNIGITGFQEFERSQRQYFLNHTTNYKIYPSDPTSTQGENAIGWDSTLFKLVDQGMMPKLQYFGAGYSLDAPWVKLEYKDTGQQLYVLNTHDPTHKENDDKRYENALQHVEFINSLRVSGLPILFTGDFNSGYELRDTGNNTYQNKAENLTYCILTKEGFMEDAFDVFSGRKVKCPNPGNDNSIDHIFVSTGLNISKYYKIQGAPQGTGASGSDHDAQVADVVIPGTDNAAKGKIMAEKVLTFVVENKSLDKMKDAMKYTFGLAKNYGYASNYQAVERPSLPNYIAIATGSTHGIDTNDLPSSLSFNGTSVFGQALSKGKTAKIYAESMPNSCYKDNKGWYVARHNPWTYVQNEAANCEKYDVGMGDYSADVRNGNLPNVGMVIPNNCHNSHDDKEPGCKLSDADDWFKDKMQQIFAGPDWKSGKLMVILTADEADKDDASQKVLTVVLHTSLNGKSINTDCSLNHYSLSKLYSEVVGATPLGKAAGARDLPSCFDMREESGAPSKWVWPLKHNINDGPCYGGSRVHAGMDMNSSTANNPVYAMHDGVVVSKGYDSAAGNYITVKSTGQGSTKSGKPVYYSYEHLQTTSVYQGQKVKFNQSVGVAGLTGNVSVSSSKAHLHIVTASTNSLGSYGNLGTTYDPMLILKQAGPAPEGYKCYGT